MNENLLGVELSVSDPAELRSLREHLRRVPGVEVTTQVPGAVIDGALGPWGDVLQMAAVSSGALVVAIKTLPAFIRSRRSDVTVTVKAGDDAITVTANNVEEALPLVERIVDARRSRR